MAELRGGSTPPVSWLDFLSLRRLGTMSARSRMVESPCTPRFDAMAANVLYADRSARATRPTTVVRLVLGSGPAPGSHNMGSSGHGAAR